MVARNANAEVVAIDDLWTLQNLDAVLILSETNNHASLVQRATEHGLHVFLEKPLAMSGHEATVIANALETSGLVSHIGFFMRELPANQQVKAIIESGSLGVITRARVSVAHDGALKGWFLDNAWMLDPAQAGFGGFGDMAVHGVDLLLWLFGSDIEAVTGSVGKVAEAPAASDHFGEGMIRFRNGPFATVVSSWVDAANPVTLEIRGTEGVVEVEDGVVRTFGFEWEPTPVPHAVDPGAALAVFVEAVGKGDPQSAGIISPRIAALSTQVVDACYQGARENRWVPVG